eukprot:gene1198-1381_t
MPLRIYQPGNIHRLYYDIKIDANRPLDLTPFTGLYSLMLDYDCEVSMAKTFNILRLVPLNVERVHLCVGMYDSDPFNVTDRFVPPSTMYLSMELMMAAIHGPGQSSSFANFVENTGAHMVTFFNAGASEDGHHLSYAPFLAIPNLEALKIRDDFVDLSDFEAIDNISDLSVSILSHSYAPIIENGMMPGILDCCPSYDLHNIDLTNYDIQVTRFCQILKDNKRITKLSLSNFCLNLDGPDPCCNKLPQFLVDHFSTLFHANNTIRSFTLQSIKLGSIPFFQGIGVNTMLTTLYLNHAVLITDEMGLIPALSNAIMVNKSITELSIMNNQLLPEYEEILSHALAVNQTITSLDVTYNRFDGSHLFPALLVSDTVQSLFIDESIKESSAFYHSKSKSLYSIHTTGSFIDDADDHTP